MTPFIIRVISLIIFPAELFIAMFLVTRNLRRRKYFWLRFIASFIVIIGFCFLFTWLKDLLLGEMDVFDRENKIKLFFDAYAVTVAISILLSAMFVVAVAALYKTNIFSVLFVCCAALSLQDITQCLFYLYLRIFGDKYISTMSAFNEPVNIVIFIAFHFAVYLLCYFLFIRKIEIGDEHLLNKSILGILIGVILINLCIGGVQPSGEDINSNIIYCFMLISRILLCVMGLCMQYFMAHRLKLQYAQMQLENIMRQQEEQYNVTKESIDAVNINAHDLKRQISVILKAVRETDRPESIEGEIHEMENVLSLLDASYNTGNKAVDIVLTEKARICLQKDIIFSAIADGGVIGFMNDVDIYAMLGNALDNAIEATEQITDKDNRVISFSLRKNGNLVAVHIENTVSHAPVFYDGLPQTVKADKSSHGYGMKSIQHVCKKHNGNLHLRCAGGIFYLDIILPSLPSAK